MPDERYYEHHCRRLLAHVYDQEGVEIFLRSPVVGVDMHSILDLIHKRDRGEDALRRVEHFVRQTEAGGW